MPDLTIPLREINSKELIQHWGPVVDNYYVYLTTELILKDASVHPEVHEILRPGCYTMFSAPNENKKDGSVKWGIIFGKDSYPVKQVFIPEQCIRDYSFCNCPIIFYRVMKR